MLTLPDFNRLRVFHAVYRRQSILKAAGELDVTRSAVSELTRVISGFRARHPRVRFEVELGVPSKLLDLLCEGGLDLALVDNGDVFEKLHPISTRTVAKEKFVLAPGAMIARKLRSKKIRIVETGKSAWVNPIKLAYLGGKKSR